jgi:hypothetical protein
MRRWPIMLAALTFVLATRSWGLRTPLWVLGALFVCRLIA